MASWILPIEDAGEDGAFYFSANLDGTDYLLNFQYNDRESFWYMDLQDVDGTPLRSGLKCVINFDLLALMSQATRPPGNIVLLDSRDDKAEATLASLGVTSELVYVEESGVDG